MRKFDFNEELHAEIMNERVRRDAVTLKEFTPEVIFFGPGTSFESESAAINFLSIGRDMFDAFSLSDSAEWYNATIRGWEIFHAGGSFFVVTAPKGAHGTPLEYVKRCTQIEWAHSVGRRCGNRGCLECY